MSGSWVRTRAIGLIGAVIAGVLIAPLAGTGTAAGAVDTIPTAAVGTAYHVDCSAQAAGIGTVERPLTSLTAVAALALVPGDQVLFRRGVTCTGQLSTRGSGAPGAPITIDAYGALDAGSPVIAGGGIGETVVFSNQQHIELRNLEITNTDAAPSARFVSQRRGVVVKNTDAGALTHIVLEDLYIHDVTGRNQKDLGGSGGIQLETYGGAVVSWFDDVVISGNRIEDVNRSGINMSTVWLCRQEMAWDSGYCSASNPGKNAWRPSTNIVITDNRLDGVGGDGIVVQMTDGALVEGNVVNDAANRANQGSNAGVWAWNADNSTFRGNTVSNTQRLAGNNDGTSFDIDYGTRNTVFEYNVSYANQGGMFFYCGCASSWLTNAGFASEGVYRYNVSVGETERVGFLAGATDGAVYNNLFLITQDSDAAFFSLGDTGSSVLFANNLVVSLREGGSTTPTVNSPNLLSWRNNAFYSAAGGTAGWPGSADTGNIYAATSTLPRAVRAELQKLADLDLGSRSGELDLSGLKRTWPALEGAGIPVAEEGTVDLYGNAVPSYCAPDIGIFQDRIDCAPASSLATGATRTYAVPATSTIRVEARVGAGGTLTAANAKGLTQTAVATAGRDRVTTTVRTTATDSTITLACTAAACDDITFATVADEIVDGSFESLLSTYGDKRSSPWSLWNANRSRTQVASGTASLAITRDGSGASSELPRVQVDAGSTYRLAGWVRSNVAGKAAGVSLGLKWGAGTEETGTAVNAATTVAQTWQYITGDITIPGDVRAVNVYCYTPGGSPATTSYCDDITLTKVSPASARITAGPTDAAVPAGARAHFHVDVDADHPYTVRWESSADGRTWSTVPHDLVGASVADGPRWLSVDGVTATSAGAQYRAVVTDAVTGDTSVSAAATLRVVEPPAAAIGALTGLTVAAGPTKAVYLVDEALDLAGLAVRAQYEGGSFSVADPALLQVATSGATARLGQRAVAVSFTDGGVTVSTTFTITVVGSVSKTISCRDIGATVTASFSQTEYGAQPATNACDNNAATSWSTWRSNSTRTAETLTLTFGSAQSIKGMSIDWVENSFAGPVTLSYLGDDQQWLPLGGALTTIVGGSTRTIEGEAPVKTTAVRLNVTYGNATYLKISEVRLITAETRTPSADARLAGLTIDGTEVADFAGDTLAYAADAQSVQALPQVAGTPSHPGAEVVVTQATLENPVASVTVTAADTLSTTTYAVTFAVAGVSSIAVDTSGAVVAYTVGDVADLSGIVVVATYGTGEEIDVTSHAEIGAVSTATAGVVSVPVSYSWRGSEVTSSFDVTVTAKPSTGGGTGGGGTGGGAGGGTGGSGGAGAPDDATVEAQPTPTPSATPSAAPTPSATPAPSATSAPTDDADPVDAAGEPASSGGDWTWAILGLVGLLLIGGVGALTMWMRRSRV